MLQEGQKAYLNSLPLERLNAPVSIKPYNHKIAEVAERVIKKIRERIPSADVRFMGASALKISGQNDIDIYVLTESYIKDKYIKKLEQVLGKWPERKWHWYEDNFEISVYISDPDNYKLKEHLDLFKILSTDEGVLNEYEALKFSMNGKTYKEYQVAKYEFYNRILGIK
jgi:hypothetical protein